MVMHHFLFEAFMDKYVYYYSDNTFNETRDWDKTLHREDGPAYIQYDTNGNKEQESWFINGNCHKLDGPASIWYYKDGTIENKYWYIDGIEYSYYKWKKHPEVQKHKLNKLINKELL